MSNTVRFTIDESGCSVILYRWPGRLGCSLHAGHIVGIRTDSGRVQRVRILEHPMEVHADSATGTKYVWVTAEVVDPSCGDQEQRFLGKPQWMAMSSV